ncbi:hypothetical protein [Paenibacillus sp. 1P07SE]|uniref:hypothetical protein n=1 Tax=Paenibacillus sp. 1P07SE TaxID=3132209 RepID=UPI0039A6B22D
MSRAMVQVPAELKETIEGMQSTFQTTTIYGVIQGLLSYYEQNEAQKKQDKHYREENMLDVGEDVKSAFVPFKEELGLSDGDVLRVLQSHYEHAAAIDKKTFALYIACKQASGSSRPNRRWPPLGM